ncbi:alpha/beta fold hydrolase [Egibacter rhizosphaerae]|uniref:Alpha/beta fold hydrolase n=1 Tax=Egibacter rhizosphaerae TaxID=1670831 RepID=A0A411YFP8_9ACTN|nr:alpha/beta fold hydrolase [Egibacter rhizosphaerae]QBI20075.1 alpha/beta fold hydrolase [Egibacter rhizosphaerae]
MVSAGTVRFCRLPDGSRVAYASAGTGPPVVMVPGWLCHLEESWSHHAAASARTKLARSHRFVWYDRLGCGLSDRDGFELSIENDVAQLTAVLDAAGIGSADLIGYSFGAPPAALFAARFPDRVRRLVFYSGFARGTAMMPRESLEALQQLIRTDWSMASQLLATRLLPNASSRDLRWFSRFQRVAAEPEMAALLLAHTWEMDVRDVLPDIRCPVLVAHDREDQTIPATASEEIAVLVPGAEFHLFEGNEHDPFIRDAGSVVEAILAFVEGRPIPSGAAPRPDGAVLTPREQEVLRQLAAGATNQQIASALRIRTKTVERHVTNLYRKLGAGGRADATRHAVAMELVPGEPSA